MDVYLPIAFIDRYNQFISSATYLNLRDL